VSGLPEAARPRRWAERLAGHRRRVDAPVPLVVQGKLTRMIGLTLEAVGCQAAVGDRCRITAPHGGAVEAEVVGFSGEKLFLMPIGDIHGLAPNARVLPTGRGGEVGVGDALLGRVLSGTGKPLDGRGPLSVTRRVPLAGRTINPLVRQRIRQPLDVGVRAINALLTVGRGQRMGLFAGSGVGKSRLLGMMTRFTTADVVVVGLIGERGREVKEFIESILEEEGMARAVVVASPADEPPVMRLHGAALATAVAEYFRDQGRHVLLLMDSLTRFAQAQREIALAIGEPPATRGYPPSVFARLPQLVERAGTGDAGGGSITAFYTVLTEVDEEHDPIADSARAILDGHVVLSRALAEGGHYPAIDIERSISRAMPEITDEAHQQGARRFRQVYSVYRQHQDLISVGAYPRGSDPQVDHAIAMYPRLMAFLRQGMGERVALADSTAALQALVRAPEPGSGGERPTPAAGRAGVTGGAPR
jgi:flagellum-specific ATP synthase